MPTTTARLHLPGRPRHCRHCSLHNLLLHMLRPHITVGDERLNVDQRLTYSLVSHGFSPSSAILKLLVSQQWTAIIVVAR